MHKFWYCHNLIRVWHPYHACRSGTKSSPMQMRLYLLVLNMAMELTMSKIGFYQKFLLVHHIIQKYYLIPSCEMIYCFLYLMFSMLKSTSLWWTSHLLSVNIMIFLIWFFKFSKVKGLLFFKFLSSFITLCQDIASEHPERFFVGEIVREKIFLQYKNEIPYACQVNVVSYKTRPAAKDFIQVEILVEKNSQKIILIGKVRNHGITSLYSSIFNLCYIEPWLWWHNLLFCNLISR